MSDVTEGKTSAPLPDSARDLADQPTVGPAEPSQPEASGPAGLPAVPGYEVLGVLGQGGMGVVYKARHQRLKRLVALKMILAGEHAGEQHLSRFRAEAEAVARLQHPHIVQLHEFGEHHGRPYFTLEFVAGGSLDRRLNGAPLPPRQAAAVVRALAGAVHHAHEQGVVHRDLKPANVLLTEDGTPKVTDFGLARQLDQQSSQTQTGAILGTPSYMAPEQAAGAARDVGPAADVYALGAILYECLTGRPPFRGATPFDTVLMVVGNDPVPPSRLAAKVPRDLETICLKCLHKDPGRRYASAQYLADDLGRFLHGEPILARPTGAAERLLKWARRRPAAAALLLLTALGMLGLIAGGLWFGEHEHAQRLLADGLRDQAEQARGQTELALVQAEQAEGKAREKAAAEERLKLDAQRLTARLARERGQGLCAAGNAGAGLLWLVHSLDLAPDRGDDVERVVRTHMDAARQAWRPLLAQFEHPGGIDVALLSPDGQRVVTVQGNEVRLWDAAGHPVGEPATHEFEVKAVAFSPDGKQLAVGAHEKVHFWSAATGKALAKHIDAGGPVWALAYSPDGKTLAVGSGKEAGGVELFDVRDHKRKSELPVPRRPRSLSFSADGSLLAAALFSLDVYVWELPSGKVLTKLRHGTSAQTAAFAPSGRTLLTGDDEQATLWRWEGDGADAKYVAGPALRHQGRVPVAAFSPDGSTCLTGGRDGTARVWQTATDQPLGPPIHHATPVAGVGYTPDGARLMTAGADGLVRLWQADLGQLIWGESAERQGRAVAVSPDDGLCVTGHPKSACVWEARTGKLQATLPHGAFVNVVVFSRDGKSVATGGSLGGVKWWETAGFKQLGGVLGEGPVEMLTFTADGKTLLAGHRRSPTIRRFDVSTGKEVLPALQHGRAVNSLRLSPDPEGKWVLTGSLDHKAQLWDAATGKPVGQAMTHDAPVVTVAFSRDARTVATCCADGTVWLWDATTQQRRLAEPLRHQGRAEHATFSQDGTTLLTAGADRSARLWDVETGRLLHRMDHNSDVSVVSFSPDGRLVLTGSSDWTARLWDAATGLPVTPPLQHQAPVLCGTFSRDGRRVFVGVNEIEGARGDGVRCWAVPRPVGGDVERLRTWAEALTGLRLDADDVIRPLDRAAWEEQSKRASAE